MSYIDQHSYVFAQCTTVQILNILLKDSWFGATIQIRLETHGGNTNGQANAPTQDYTG